MLSIEQTIQQIVDELSQRIENTQIQTELIKIDAALRRVCADDVVSPMAVPPFDNSAMDGYAINVKNTNLDQLDNLPISQRIPAGVAPQPLQTNTAARIFTGGVMPDGADAVVIQEHCQLDEHGTCVSLLKPVYIGENIRRQGQDIQANDVVVAKGTQLSAVHIGLLASMGCIEVRVYKKIKVAIFSTGDELVQPGQQLQPGQIYNSNRSMLFALCRQLDVEIVDLGVVADQLNETMTALNQAAQQADLIISSGGVSVGEEDHVKDAVEQLGHLNLWKINMKPGKPVAFGAVNDIPFLGLPGNPVSSFVTFQLIAQPAIQTLQGQPYQVPVTYPVVAGFTKALVTRQEYLRVKLQTHNGLPTAQLFGNQSSGVLSSLCWADGFVIHQPETAIQEGQSVQFMPMMG